MSEFPPAPSQTMGDFAFLAWLEEALKIAGRGDDARRVAVANGENPGTERNLAVGAVLTALLRRPARTFPVPVAEALARWEEHVLDAHVARAEHLARTELEASLRHKAEARRAALRLHRFLRNLADAPRGADEILAGLEGSSEPACRLAVQRLRKDVARLASREVLDDMDLIASYYAAS